MRTTGNPFAYRRVIVAEAVLLTIVIHAGLLFLFSYEKPAVVPVPQRQGSLTLLQNFDARGPEGEKFLRWIAFHDPSGIGRGDSGYGAMMDKVTPVAPEQPENTIKFAEPAPLLPPPVTALPSIAAPAFPAAVSPFSAAPAALEPVRYPAVEIDGRPPVWLAPAPEELAALGRLPRYPAVFSLAREDGDPVWRFTIRRSSGDAAADILAARLVMRRLSSEPGSALRAEAVVFWRSAPGGEQ